jgi:hypothetical protein
MNELEISLLIAMMKKVEQGCDSFNFEIIYSDYYTVSSVKNAAQKKTVAMKVFSSNIK